MCHNAVCYADFCTIKSHYTEFHNVLCFMLSVIVLSVVKLNVHMLNVVMPSTFKLSMVMLGVW